jgi:HSP20 family molecular chaperone IbpA
VRSPASPGVLFEFVKESIMNTSLTKRRKGNGLFASERDPFSAMRKEFDHMLSRFTGWDWMHAPAVFSPSLDMRETESGYEVNLDLPGINPAEIHIQLVDNVLTITGERQEEKPKAKRVAQIIESNATTASSPARCCCRVR